MTSPGDSKRDERALLATWIALMALTLGSFQLAESSSPGAGAAAWVLGFAALKGHLIAAVFMEMRRGPRPWSIVMSAFLLAEAALIVTLLH